MVPLDRLLELLGITEQHHAPRTRGDRQHVRERHLPRLVHEQHVRGLEGLIAGPQPGGAADDVSRAAESGQRGGVVGRFLDAGIGVLALLGDLPQTLDADLLFLGRLHDFPEQIRDHLVAHRADPHTLSRTHQVADHAGTGEGLARPGRALDRERSMIQPEREPTRRSHTAFARRFEPAAGVPGQPWPAPQEQVARGAVGPGCVHAVRGDPLPQSHERFRLLLRRHRLVREDARRVEIRARSSLLDLHGA